MIKFNLQLFAHKKGMGSTKNGRESQSKRLGAKKLDSAEPRSIPAQMSESVLTIHFSL